MTYQRQVTLTEEIGFANTSVTAANALPDYVTIATGGGGVLGRVRVKRATLQLDSSFVPYAQATIVCPIPDAATYANLDPLAGRRITFNQRTIVDGVTSDLTWHWNLFLRTRSVDYAAGEMTLTCYSDESQLMDYAKSTTSTAATGAAVSIGDFVAARMTSEGLVIGGNINTPSTPATLVSVADQQWLPGVTMWDFFQNAADAVGARIYSDEGGSLYVASGSYVKDSSAHSITDQPGGTVKNVIDAVSRDDPRWSNTYLILYNGSVNSATGAQANYISHTGDTTYRKCVVVSSPNAKPTSGNPANQLGALSAAAGQTLTVNALLDQTARPGQVYTVQYAGITHTGTVRSVTFNYPEGTMDLIINVTS